MLRALILLLIFLPLLLAADDCRSNDDDDDATREAVGFVKGQVDYKALIDSSDAYAGAFILRGSGVETDTSGAVWFEITGFVTCDTRHDSKLAVFPVADTVIHWAGGSGLTYCVKDDRPGTQTYNVGDRIHITLNDPIFGVVQEDGVTIIQVVDGSLTVTVDGVDYPLAAHEQLRVPDVGGPSGPEPLELTDEAQATVDRLRGETDLPDLTAEFTSYEAPDDKTCLISYTLHNDGAVAASESTTRILIGGEQLDDEAPSVPPGELISMTAEFGVKCPNVPNLTGSMEADALNVIAESNEDNNVSEIFATGP